MRRKNWSNPQEVKLSKNSSLIKEKNEGFDTKAYDPMPSRVFW